MSVSTETQTTFAALSSRILAAPGLFPQDHPLNDIWRDLSWLERGTLEQIVKAKWADSGLVVSESDITALKIVQERLYKKHQIGPFVAKELKALADFTGTSPFKSPQTMRVARATYK